MRKKVVFLFLFLILISFFISLICVGIVETIQNDNETIPLNNQACESSLIIDSGFNNSQATMVNISIPLNESITLNNTGHYSGFESFWDDSIGSNPDGWTISESNGVIQIISEPLGVTALYLRFYNLSAFLLLLFGQVG